MRISQMLLCACLCLNATEPQVRIAVPGDGPVEVQADPPVQWSVPEKSSLAWTAELPFGEDAGGPLVVDDQVIVCTHDEKVVSFNLSDGNERWRTEVSVFDLDKNEAGIKRGKELRDQILRIYAEDPTFTAKPSQGFWEPNGAITKEFGVPPIARCRYMNHPWGGSPAVADGKAIYVKFATGIVGALDRQGKILWKQRFTERKGTRLIHTTAPHLLCGDRVVVAGTSTKVVEGRQMALTAYACTDGKQLWRTDAIAGANHNDWVPMRSVVVGGTPLLVTASGAVLRLDDGQVFCPGGVGGSIGNAFWGGRFTTAEDSVWFGPGRTRLMLEGKELRITNPFGTFALAELKAENTVSGSSRLSLIGNRMLAIEKIVEEWDLEKGATKPAGKVETLARFEQLFDGKPSNHPPLIEPAAAAGRVYLPVGSTMKILDLKTFKLVAANPCGGHLVGAPMPSGTALILRTTKHLLKVGQ